MVLKGGTEVKNEEHDYSSSYLSSCAADVSLSVLLLKGGGLISDQQRYTGKLS